MSKAQTFAKGAANAALTGEDMSQAQARAGWSAFMPLGNFLPFSALFSHMIESLPEKVQR
ncbi:hypothetical protein [Mesorhizobium sp. B2-8-9]|uniref:hypothetical protein n=1 Tax=Mesorhizobium sp. B2-8-9 TaxID=2589899 RepID=UPI00112E2FD9|nr:hypothetical protein [Mesorhizobium sp. B2-8-9]TPI83485.1 hypothetical protein FJ423_07580 [Mesorhizobium sp. B2-8-9]